MNQKQLRWHVDQYLRALNLAIFYRVPLSVEQYAACHALDPEDLEALQAALAEANVGV